MSCKIEMKIIFFLILLTPVMLIPVFSQSPITFDVDTTTFVPGEIVELKGTVDIGLEGKLIAVEIKDAEGNIILIRTVTSDINGEFTLKFKVPSTVKDGEFDIVTNIEIDGQSFSETKSVETKSVETIKMDPEPKPTCGKGTVLKDDICVIDIKQQLEPEKNPKGGGCLIATATYGSELAPQVQSLRELRDNSLLNTESGSTFMELFNNFYYSFSPIIADYERENPIFREAIKIAITPMITSLSILNYVDMNSEESVLGYGISLIILNGMMYFGIPAIIISRIRK